MASASTLASIALAGLAAVAIAATAPSRAEAAPTQLTCRVTFYYSSAKKTQQVGLFAQCPGGVQQGRKTPWFNVETFTIALPTQTNPPPVGTLPCEFLQAGCSTFQNH